MVVFTWPAVPAYRKRLPLAETPRGILFHEGVFARTTVELYIHCPSHTEQIQATDKLARDALIACGAGGLERKRRRRSIRDRCHEQRVPTCRVR